MTVRMLFGRPLPGVVGETRRMVHVFEIPAGDTVPERLTAFCQASFGPGQLELLDRPQGMPCESCMRQAPTPAPELPADPPEPPNPAAQLDRDFQQLSREREIGEPLTDDDWAAAKRVVNTYWPRFGTPRPLPERWR